MGKFGLRFNRYAAIGGSGLILASVSAKNREEASKEIAVKEKYYADWVEGGKLIRKFPIKSVNLKFVEI